MQWGKAEAEATATALLIASGAAAVWIVASAVEHGGSAIEIDHAPPAGVVDQIATFGIAMAGLVIVGKATMALLEMKPCTEEA